MLANFFNKSKPITQLIAVLLFVGFYTLATFKVFNWPFSVEFVLKNSLFFLWHLFFLLVFNFVIVKNKLTKDNLFSIFLGVLILSAFYNSLFNRELVLANIAILLALRKNYSFKNGFKMEAKLFDFGFWIGVSMLFYNWTILFLLLGYSSLFIYQKVSFKNLFIPLIGLITPVFLFFTYCFYVGNLLLFRNVLLAAPSFNIEAYNNWHLLIPLSLLLTIIVWSVFSMTSKISSDSMKNKQNWNVLLINLLVGMSVLLLAPIKNGAEIIFIVFPGAILIANFLQNNFSNTFKNMILYLFLAITIAVYFL